MRPYPLARKPNGCPHESCGELILEYSMFRRSPSIYWDWEASGDYDAHYRVSLVVTDSRWITDGVTLGFAAAAGINLSKNHICELTHSGKVFIT